MIIRKFSQPIWNQVNKLNYSSKKWMELAHRHCHWWGDCFCREGQRRVQWNLLSLPHLAAMGPWALWASVFLSLKCHPPLRVVQRVKWDEARKGLSTASSAYKWSINGNSIMLEMNDEKEMVFIEKNVVKGGSYLRNWRMGKIFLPTTSLKLGSDRGTVTILGWIILVEASCLF